MTYVLANARWDRTTSAIVASLRSRKSKAGGAQPFSADRLAGLPVPVARYFGVALTSGQPMIRTARISHTGEFRSSMNGPWRPFRSTQYFSTGPIGFVWDANIRVGHGIDIRVRDSYLSGRAEMRARIAGVIPVVDQAGTLELASGALHRFLAEALWLPTALLPSETVQWTGLDDTAAVITLTDNGATVSVECHFDADRGIGWMVAERFRDVNGVGELTPFVARLLDYGTISGMRIPTRAEVGWVLPEGWFPFWRGTVVDAEYDFAAPAAPRSRDGYQ